MEVLDRTSQSQAAELTGHLDNWEVRGFAATELIKKVNKVSAGFCDLGVFDKPEKEFMFYNYTQITLRCVKANV